jgi:hypothetical protein
MIKRSYLEYKKYLEVKEGVGFQWTQDLVGGLQDILQAFTRGRRASAINNYFDKVFEYGKLRGTEIGENAGPKLEENIGKDTDFKYEQLILEIEWSKTALINIRKYIFEVIKNVVGEVTANNIRENKIEVPTFLKLISEESNLAIIDKNKNLSKTGNTSVSVPNVKTNYTNTNTGSTQTGGVHPGQTQIGTGDTLSPDMEVKNATWSEVKDKPDTNSTPSPTDKPETDNSKPDEKKFEDMTETERIKLLSFLDQRIQDFIEMKSPMINKLFKLWSEFLFIKKTSEKLKNENKVINEDSSISLESYKELLLQTGKIIETHGGNIENPILYDILAYTLAFIGSEGYFDFYKPTANQLVDKDVRRFASAMIPGRSMSHTLILIVSALTSLEVSLEYVKDKIRRKHRTVDKSMVRREEYTHILSITKDLSNQPQFIKFETITYKSLRRHFNKYFLALGINSGKKLYEVYTKNGNLQEIYKILFFDIPNATNTPNATDDTKFFTYPNTNVEATIKNSDVYTDMIEEIDNPNKIDDIVNKYFGILLDGDKDYNKKITEQIGSIEINFKNLVDPSNSTNTTKGTINYNVSAVKPLMSKLSKLLQILYTDWEEIYNDKENADDREDGSA